MHKLVTGCNSLLQETGQCGHGVKVAAVETIIKMVYETLGTEQGSVECGRIVNEAKAVQL